MVGCQDQIIFSSKSFQEIIKLGLGLCISRFVDFPRFGRLPEANHVLIKKSHQPSGLRWFRFKTLPIFQLGGFTLPPTPFPGLWFQGFAGWNRTFIRCSFRAPFFSPLGTPQNRYHKLFRLQSDPILRSKTGSKTSSHFGTGFFSNLFRFSHFFHTTSSASRIAPAISKPHFRLSSFLLFLLSLRPSF